MRFLITCYNLNLSGSSTYTLTLASELKRKGYEVDVFSFFPEIIGSEFKKRKINVYENLEKISKKKYSFIIAQHNILALVVRCLKLDVPMIFISHGVTSFLDFPPSMDLNIQKYIAISEEVKNNLKLSNISSDNIEIVRNFVDTERFFPKKELNQKPSRALFLSNRFIPEVYRVVKSACRKLKLKLVIVGKPKKAFNVEDYMNEADIVISLGRGTLEAMACGRAVLVYDYMGGDGMITEENIGEIRKWNFSGRRFSKKYSINDLMQEIKKYKKSMGRINREIVLKDHNASLAVEKIINVCKDAQKIFKPTSVVVPDKEIMWCRDQIKGIYDSRTWFYATKLKKTLTRFKFL